MLRNLSNRTEDEKEGQQDPVESASPLDVDQLPAEKFAGEEEVIDEH